MNSYIINSLLRLQHLRVCFHPCQQSSLLVTRLAPLAEFYGSSALCLSGYGSYVAWELAFSVTQGC